LKSIILILSISVLYFSFQIIPINKSDLLSSHVEFLMTKLHKPVSK
jgi:hypothetical protein